MTCIGYYEGEFPSKAWARKKTKLQFFFKVNVFYSNYSYITVWKIHQEGHGAIDGVLACGACSPGFDSRDIPMFFPQV